MVKLNELIKWKLAFFPLCSSCDRCTYITGVAVSSRNNCQVDTKVLDLITFGINILERGRNNLRMFVPVTLNPRTVESVLDYVVTHAAT